MSAEIDLEAAVPTSEMGPRFRLVLAALVGVAAISASVVSFLETSAGRDEEQAFVDASRLATEASVKVSASQPKLNFELAAARESAVLSTQAQSRQTTTGGGLVPFQVALGLSAADVDTSTRLLRLARAMSELPEGAEGLDPLASAAVRVSEQEQIDAIYAEQAAKLEEAETSGTRQERAMFALGLIAIGASLLAVAGLIGESRAGRGALATAAATLAVSLLAAASGFV